MKAYKFLLGIFALAAIAISCDDDEEDYVIPAMSIDKTALSFDETGGASAAQTVYVTSNRDWEATCDADWVFFSPSSAKASDNSVEVSVYVDANTGTDRTAKLTFDGATVSATVTVSQTGPSGASYGEGTADSPYTVSDALTIINAGSYTSKNVYVKGIISKIDEIDTGSYGNATYYISDDGTTDEHLEVYRGYSLGGAKFTSEDEIKVGDEVIVYGELTMYGTTPEITQGSSIYYLNGVTADVGDVGDHELAGDGTVDNPYTATDALWLANDGSYTSDKVYVKGIISGTPEIDTSYGNATYYISDDGSTTNRFEIYRGYSLGGAKFTSTDEIKEGDEVIVYGEITMYYTTPEMTTGSSIYSLNGVTSDVGGGDDGDTGDLTGDGTADNPYTATDALWLANSGNYTDDEVYVKGIISQIDEISTSYGNATYYISDDGTTTEQFEIYRGYSLDGAKFTSSTEIEVGDKVVVCGVITMFYSTPEMTAGSKIVSLEKGEGTGGGDEGGDEGGDTGGLDLTGSGTLADPYTASDALALVANDSSYDQSVYIKGIVSEVGSLNSNYNELNYYISDDGTTANQLYVYCGYGLNGEKIYSADYLSVGDELVIYGELKAYNGSAEVNYGSKIITINGDDGNGDVDDSDPYVQNVTWENVSSSNCSYSESAYINGSTTAYNFCRVGKSGTIGHATCKVPAGTKALHFYCIAWNNGGPAPFTVTVGSTAYDSYTATAHSGLANSSPYTIDDVTDSDYFEITFDELSADTEVKVETTSSSKPRVAFIGFKYITD